jgi:hypothetical protein
MKRTTLVVLAVGALTGLVAYTPPHPDNRSIEMPP